MGRKRELLDYFVDTYESNLRMKGEKKKIKRLEQQKIVQTVTLTKEQKLEIDEFYKKNLGKKISYDWHRLYTAFTGIFDVSYFPELFYIPVFEFYSNKREYAKVFVDKNITPYLAQNIKDLRIPTLFCSCSNGIYCKGGGYCKQERGRKYTE